jgi:hypothetical protein
LQSIPLNLFVCVVLGNVEAFPLAGMFGLCAAFMAASLAAQVQLERLSVKRPSYHKVPSDGDHASAGAAAGSGGSAAAGAKAEAVS